MDDHALVIDGDRVNLQTLLMAVVYLGGSAFLAYVTTRYTMRREHRHGAMRLLELCRRYIFNYLRARQAGGVTASALTRAIYLRELEVIVDRLDALLDASYGRLAVAYPPISSLVATLRAEKVALSETERDSDAEALRLVLETYRALKAHMPVRVRENDYDRDLEKRISLL